MADPPGILSPLANFLLNEEVDPNTDSKTVVAPCFNYYKLDPNDPLQSLKNEITAAVAKYEGKPQKEALENIQGTINGLRQLPAV